MYSETEISRLKEILKYRHAGLSISEISRILGQDSSIRKEVLLGVLERMMKQKKEMETNILSVRGLLESI
jgi:DNA-binding transcriptional MerR regulator